MRFGDGVEDRAEVFENYLGEIARGGEREGGVEESEDGAWGSFCVGVGC